MAKRARKTCGQCQRLQQRLDAQAAEIETWRDELARLQEKLATAKKTSATSSKPPSSDIVKPAACDSASGPRAPGGQLGHERHQRPPLSPDQLTKGSQDHLLELCPGCGHGLQPSAAVPRVVQQIDIQDVPIISAEHRSVAGGC